MKSILRYTLLAAALAAGATPSLAQTSPPAAGKVLVLDNGRTLEGDIERHGDQYRISRTVGEVWLPAEPGMRLCAGWKEAYKFMAAQANLLDPDERVRLARWCQLHGLREQAVAELNAALQMQPRHNDARQMRAVLERSLIMEKTPAPPTAPGERPATEKAPSVDISSDAVAMFTSRVQPILMNACVSCHSGSKTGSFQLYRTYNGGQRVATLKNVAAVLPLVNCDNPELSAFLIKAVSPHGPPGQSPLKKDSVAFYTLQTWVMHLIAGNPQLRAERHAAATSVSGPDAKRVTPMDPRPLKMASTGISHAGQSKSVPVPLSQVASGAQALGDQTQALHAAAPAPDPNRESATGFASPASAATEAAAGRPQTSTFAERTQPAPAEPTDPFDPAIFNQLSR